MRQKILFAEKFLPMIREGKKTTTIRNGERNYSIGECDAFDPEEVNGFIIDVKNLEITTFGALKEENAKTDGFSCLAELKEELLSFYPDLTDDSPVTIVSIGYSREFD